MSKRGSQASKAITRREIKAVLDGLFPNKGKKVLKETLLKELDPGNDKLFGLEIGEILKNVDLAKGSEDFSRKDSKNAFDHSGIKYVYERIKHYLIDSGITENVFVEYSLLPSTLDPQSMGKLQCMSFIVGEKEFKKKIKDNYTICIAKTRDDNNGISIYDHPDFLYNIPDKDEVLEKSDSGVSTFYNGRGLRISRIRANKVKGSTKIKPNEKPNEEDKSKYNAISYKKKVIDIGAFNLARSFDEMLLTAKALADDEKGAENNGRRSLTLTDIHTTLHRYCHENISKREEKSTGKNRYHQSVYVSFPVFGARAANQLLRYEIKNEDEQTIALQGIGACFIYFEPKKFLNRQSKTSKNAEDLRTKVLDRIIGKITYEICTFIRFASANYLLNLGLQLQDKARKEALKSAKSAIMSRNMSHNLGSHVMSYLKQNLSSVQSVLNDRILALLFENEADMFANLSVELKNAINSKETEKGALPFLVGLGQFISYLQERQDFIATIATDFIPYLSTVNFKDFIYDELNPDKRYERHKDRKNYKIDNILLGNIARSEGLGRPTSPTITLSKDGKETPESKLNDIVIKFRSFDGNPVKDPSGNISNPEGNDALLHMRDYDLSLPGGVVGRQAIFSIVENTIRNAAKHGNWRDKGKLELTFDIYTKDELLKYKDYIKSKQEIEQKGHKDDALKQQKEKLEANHPRICSLLDDKGCGLSLWEVFDKFYLNAKDSKDIYIVTLTDNLSTDTEKLEKLRLAIKEPLVNERGEMNEGSKGIKEMRISAAWLRGITESEAYNPIEENVEKNDEKNDSKLKPEEDWEDTGMYRNAPPLYARISKQQDGNHLQYIFCILRPKKVAIISSKFPRESESQDENVDNLYNKEAFLRNSWSAFHPIDYINEKNKSFEFVIYDEGADINDSWWLDLRYVSSSRLLKLSDIPEIKTELFNKINVTFGNGEKELEAEKSLYNGMLSSLYRHVSHYDENEDHILIDDAKTYAKKINEKYFIPFKAVTIIDGQSKDKSTNGAITGIVGKSQYQQGQWYIYRTHHESSNEFHEFMKTKYGVVFRKNAYVEGITGNNSTDRLIRNEKIDEYWTFRHLHAMKEKVAVIDERIFTKIYGIEESDISTYSTDWSTMDDELSRRYFSDFEIKDFDEQDKLMCSSDWHDKLKVTYPNEVTERTIIQSEDSIGATTGYTPTIYTQKGVFVFTIIRAPEREKTNQFYLYGIKRKKTEGNIDIDDVSDDKYVSSCKKVAIIRWEKESERLMFDWMDEKEEDFFKNKFDRITIHQGLLDKMYAVFGIKDKSKQKEKLTKNLFEELSLNPSNIAEVAECSPENGNDENRIRKVEENCEKKDASPKKSFYLLPGMCIHSGRSKPSENDMPQHLPFIQYAAIENAVLDCKYSLVELLDYARYE